MPKYTLQIHTVNISLSGTEIGDPDLYVRFDEVPTSNDWDCRPWIKTQIDLIYRSLIA